MSSPVLPPRPFQSGLYLSLGLLPSSRRHRKRPRSRGFPSSLRSARRVSRPLGGLLRFRLCWLVSSGCHVQGSRCPTGSPSPGRQTGVWHARSVPGVLAAVPGALLALLQTASVGLHRRICTATGGWPADNPRSLAFPRRTAARSLRAAIAPHASSLRGERAARGYHGPMPEPVTGRFLVRTWCA